MNNREREILRKIANEEVETEEEDNSTALVEVEDRFLSGQEKQSFFKFLKLPAERVNNMQLTKKQAKRLIAHVSSLRTGTHATVPLICTGVQCPFVETCPFTEYNKSGEISTQDSVWPVLSQCPVESNVLARKIMDMVEEYRIDPEDITDIAIVTKLAELDVMDHRLNLVLAKESAQRLVIEETSHIDENGNVHTTLREHPAFAMKEKVHRQRKDLLREMVATRREKAKIIGNSEEVMDAVKETTRLASKVRQLLDAEEADVIDITEAEDYDGE